LTLFKSSNKQYVSIQNMIVKVSEKKYFYDDCFIEHLAFQREKIKILQNENYKLKLKNAECYNKISYQPILLNEPIKKNNIKYCNIYCKIGFVILTTILIVPIVIWFVNTF